MPWLKIMVTGGVEPTEENLSAWFKAGVACVGMGSKLFPKEVIKNRDWKFIANLCENCLTIIENNKKP
jgi:2-dehydro-3-deoxyphosphogluconate aldolase/(4S)-4-hydroxy-2-oxoglutarate aldolase